LFSIIDENKNGIITYNELEEILNDSNNDSKDSNEKLTIKLFQLIDIENKG